MKKIVLVMFTMLSMTTAFAENENANRVNVAVFARNPGESGLSDHAQYPE